MGMFMRKCQEPLLQECVVWSLASVVLRDTIEGGMDGHLGRNREPDLWTALLPIQARRGAHTGALPLLGLCESLPIPFSQHNHI